MKNYTRQGLSVSIPLGFVEGRPQIENYEYEYLIDLNRELYSAPPMLPADAPFPSSAKGKEQKAITPVLYTKQKEDGIPEDSHEAPAASIPKRLAESKPKDIPEPGRGGRQHKYLQHLIKQLGEERGFRATIEETILGGAGRVDVSLARDGKSIAFQVSVSTTKDWELGGIEKCLAHGYSEVVLVGSTERHIQGLSKFIEESLQEKDQGKVRYLTSETLLPYLDSFGVPPTTEKVVRGYKVRTVQQTVSPEDVIQRRKAVAEVIARSLVKSKSG